MTPREHLDREWKRMLMSIQMRVHAERRGWAPAVIDGWRKTTARHWKNIHQLVDVVSAENHAPWSSRR